MGYKWEVFNILKFKVQNVLFPAEERRQLHRATITLGFTLNGQSSSGR